MRLSIIAIAICGVLGMSQITAADEIEDRFEKKVFTAKDGGTLNYRYLAPVAPKAGEKYPLVIFLHGAGERGDDNTIQLIHGVKRFAQDDFLKKYPCYVIAPQCPKDLIWASTKWTETAAFKDAPSVPTKKLMELIDTMEATLAVDTHREYVTGLSMGGYGSWDMAMRQPHRFAAIAPVCAGADCSRMESIKHLPIWIFHGDQDQGVKVERAREAVAALKAVGANPIYSEYPGVGHNSWVQAYADLKFYEWLFAQKNEKPMK
jgi:predicted peptidase